jgi:hypothetical protein
MDIYPLDTATQRGGDGSLDIRDLIHEMFRAGGLDSSRPTRASKGGCTSSSSKSEVHTAAPTRPPLEVDGDLWFGPEETVNGSQSRVPVYLEARHDLNQVALTFALGDRHSPLTFVAAETSPSISQSGQTGVLAEAWLAGLSLPPGGRLLLGYVEGPAASLAGLEVYGVSAVRLGDDQLVGIDAPNLAARNR